MTIVNSNTAGKMPQLLKELGKPFEPGCVGWKPSRVNGAKAIALAYIDSRDVMDRLDMLVAAELLDGWRDEYDVLPGGSVRCRLYLCVGGEWVAKEDVGSPSQQPDAGDKMKAAFSDALKRAAVKWGVGRYLYHLDAPWVEYDPQRKRFTRTPDLPTWAKPGGSGRPPTYSLPPHLAAEHIDDPAGADKNGPLPAPPKPPTAHHRENPALRAKYATRFAQAKTPDDFKAIRADLVRDHEEGVLTDADIAQLRGVADETKTRVGVQPAAAK